MKVKFKNTDMEFNCTRLPVEQKLFKGTDDAGWLMSFSFEGYWSSSNIKDFVNIESITEIEFIATNSNKEVVTKTISGYTKINSCIIRHEDTTCVVEIQLSKGVQTV